MDLRFFEGFKVTFLSSFFFFFLSFFLSFSFFLSARQVTLDMDEREWEDEASPAVGGWRGKARTTGGSEQKCSQRERRT